MDHLLLKATTTTQDQGVFEAVISTASVDREKDIVRPEAMVEALQKWAALEKKIPLTWEHSTKPENIVGYIDPTSVEQRDGEVFAKGWIDQSTERGAEAWRLVKTGTVGFSFGYMITQATPIKGGGADISGLDVFEVSATMTPMNPDTRVVGYKSVEQEEEARALRARADEVEAELRTGGLKAQPRPEPHAAEGLFDADELQAAVDGLIKAVWTGSYVNDLPDSAFLYIEPGGQQDADGRTTPRSLRHFPYKDASGAIDLPHLRNALSRIPQSSLSSSLQEELTRKAQQILQNATKSVDVTDKEQPARSVDPLRKRADDMALEVASGGRRPSQFGRPAPPPKPPELMELAELKRRSRDLMLQVLSGME